MEKEKYKAGSLTKPEGGNVDNLAADVVIICVT